MPRLTPLLVLSTLIISACSPLGSLSTEPVVQTATVAVRDTAAPGSREPGMPFDPPRPGKVETDITYCSPDGLPQKLDIYYPPPSTARLRPAVVYIHGGSWQQGDKDTALYLPAITELQGIGFLIASINYRLAPGHTFPAQIEDSRCAVRFLRAHAGEYQIDPDRIGALGDSAGGHLAALLGLAGANTTWNTPQYADQSAEVQAVVDLYGISDLTHLSDINGIPIWPQVFNASRQTDPLLAAAGPLTYVQAGAPPFLIIHGKRDHIVPFEQSQWLSSALQAAGNPVEFLEVQNADHGFVSAGNQPIRPDYAEINRHIVDFFVENLR